MMWLVLTADRHFFTPGEPTTYLGEWCVADRGADPPDNPVLPYALDEPGTLHDAYRYCDEVYRALAPQLAASLNTLHDTRNSVRFWEIFVGYWLREYIEIMYDRYRSVEGAVRTLGNEARVKVLDSASHLTVADGHEFSTRSVADLYNQQLYSQVIQFLGVFDRESVVVDQTAWASDTVSTRRTLPKGLKDLVKWICLLGSRGNRIYLSATYLPLPTLLALAARLRSFPTLDVPRFQLPRPARDHRQIAPAFASLTPRDRFEALIRHTLTTNLPLSYAENFGALRRKVARFYPRRSRLILTGNSFATNDGFRFWAAEQVEHHGARYVIHQHGGNYGCGRWNSSEDYETRVSDEFLSYGWSDPGKDNVVPFYASRIRHHESGEVQGRNAGDILWVLVSLPRYAYTMYAVPAGPQFRHYLEEQARFFHALSAESQRLIRCRPYPHAYGWRDIATIEEIAKCGRVPLDPLRGSVARQLKSLRLFVSTYNATAYLESMAANVPTIIYWTPEHWQIRDEAREMMHALHAVGVLHYTPEEAAAAVDAVRDDALEWWGQRDIQDLRTQFCERFAHTCERPARTWADWLKTHGTTRHERRGEDGVLPSGVT